MSKAIARQAKLKSATYGLDLGELIRLSFANEAGIVVGEQSLARLIRLVAEQGGRELQNLLLQALADNLDCPESPYKLVLTRQKAGRFRNPDKAAGYDRAEKVTQHVFHEYRSYGKLESALKSATEKFGLSRQTLLNDINLHAEYLAAFTHVTGAPNPIAFSSMGVAEQEEYNQFRIWLDRYSRFKQKNNL